MMTHSVLEVGWESLLKITFHKSVVKYWKIARIALLAKGWLAIAKLKPLSLFISLF